MANLCDQSLSQFELDDFEVISDEETGSDSALEFRAPNYEEAIQDAINSGGSERRSTDSVVEKKKEKSEQESNVNPAEIEESGKLQESTELTPEAWARIRAYVKKRKEEEQMKIMAEAEKLEKLLDGEKEEENGPIPVSPKTSDVPQAASTAAPKTRRREAVIRIPKGNTWGTRWASYWMNEESYNFDVIVDFFGFFLVLCYIVLESLREKEKKTKTATASPKASGDAPQPSSAATPEAHHKRPVIRRPTNDDTDGARFQVSNWTYEGPPLFEKFIDLILVLLFSFTILNIVSWCNHMIKH